MAWTSEPWSFVFGHCFYFAFCHRSAGARCSCLGIFLWWILLHFLQFFLAFVPAFFSRREKNRERGEGGKGKKGKVMSSSRSWYVQENEECLRFWWRIGPHEPQLKVVGMFCRGEFISFPASAHKDASVKVTFSSKKTRGGFLGRTVMLAEASAGLVRGVATFCCVRSRLVWGKKLLMEFAVKGGIWKWWDCVLGDKVGGEKELEKNLRLVDLTGNIF